jgi:hypothetical protein
MIIETDNISDFILFARKLAVQEKKIFQIFSYHEANIPSNSNTNEKTDTNFQFVWFGNKITVTYFGQENTEKFDQIWEKFNKLIENEVLPVIPFTGPIKLS